MNWEQAAAGYTGVWARANTRGEIFDALRRGEAYATTGPRMNVRFFGGWRFTETDARSSRPAHAGYVKGVPMGSDLPPRPEPAGAPTFLVLTSQDPEGAALQRVQVVKGWLGADGVLQERVVDVSVAEDPRAGASSFSAIHTDTDFDPQALAFYYLRVIEVPTPRWNAIDAVKAGRALTGMRLTHQERAYTSPIWYTPASD
jgi:hypothetical protein